MNKVEDRLLQIRDMDIIQLRRLWKRQFKFDPGPHISIQILRMALAYRFQEREYKAAERVAAIRRLALRDKRRPEDTGWGYGEKFSPGTRFLREYKGKVHEVLVVDYGRFVYAGEVFRSLSAAAGKITGKRTGGTLFFGLAGKGLKELGP